MPRHMRQSGATKVLGGASICLSRQQATAARAWRTAVWGQVFRHLQQGGAWPFTLCGVTVLLDVEKFFDELPMEIAVRLAIQAAVPFWMVRAAFTAYSWDRRLKVGP